MKKTISVLTGLLLTLFGYSQTVYTTTGSGAWDDASIWDVAGFPDGSDDIAVIASGFSVDVSGSETCGKLQLAGNLSLVGGTSAVLNVLIGPGTADGCCGIQA